MLNCTPNVVPSRRCREMTRFQDDSIEVFARASRSSGDLVSDHLRVTFKLGLELALVVVGSDDDVTTLAPCGVELVVMNNPSPDCVVIAVDLGHWPILSLRNSTLHDVGRHDVVSINEPPPRLRVVKVFCAQRKTR